MSFLYGEPKLASFDVITILSMLGLVILYEFVIVVGGALPISSMRS